MRDYNTSRTRMKLPEYGRNVQKMVDYAVQLPTKEERNEAAATIIEVMGIVNQSLKDTSDYKRKLWDHLAIMSDFKLDVDYPFELPERHSLEEAPQQVPYPEGNIRFRHYGKIVENMIGEAVKMDDGDKKDALKLLIANFIKRSYLTWNRDTVDDETILKDLDALSSGALTLDDSVKLLDNIRTKNGKHAKGSKQKQSQSKNWKRNKNHHNHRNS